MIRTKILSLIFDNDIQPLARDECTHVRGGDECTHVRGKKYMYTGTTLQTQRPPRYIESNTGKSARQGNLTNYMHKKIRLVPFLTFIKETYKTLNKSGQSTNGDNCYKNLRDHANNYTTPKG